MKIAAIAKVIKDRGSCRLYRVHGPDDVETKFYIGTNSEIYSLEGFPKPWSEAEVMTMLGIEKKKWEDVIYTAYDCNTITDVCGLNLEDAVQNEVECKTSYINLNIGGALLPINLSGNLLETLQKMVNMARETARLCKTEDKKAE